MAQLYDDPQRNATCAPTGRRVVKDYVIDLRRWSADTSWTDTALHQFHLGLSEGLNDEIARVPLPSSLEAIITLSIQIDCHLCKRKDLLYFWLMGLA